MSQYNIILNFFLLYSTAAPYCLIGIELLCTGAIGATPNKKNT